MYAYCISALYPTNLVKIHCVERPPYVSKIALKRETKYQIYVRQYILGLREYGFAAVYRTAFESNVFDQISFHKKICEHCVTKFQSNMPFVHNYDRKTVQKRVTRNDTSGFWVHRTAF